MMSDLEAGRFGIQGMLRWCVYRHKRDWELGSETFSDEEILLFKDITQRYADRITVRFDDPLVKRLKKAHDKAMLASLRNIMNLAQRYKDGSLFEDLSDNEWLEIKAMELYLARELSSRGT